MGHGTDQGKLYDSEAKTPNKHDRKELDGLVPVWIGVRVGIETRMYQNVQILWSWIRENNTLWSRPLQSGQSNHLAVSQVWGLEVKPSWP